MLTSIRQIHQESHGACGTPRILEVLRKKRRRAGKNRIDRLKRHAAIFAWKFRRYRVATTDSKHDQRISPNLLNQDFEALRPNQVWLSDITYIRLATGASVYPCVTLDLISRQIAGGNLASHMRTELVLGALNQAVCRRRPSSGLIFHSDRGVQYASKDFRKELKRGRFRQSMSRKGNCYNNAPMESFFAMLKIEEIYRTSYESLAAAKRKLFDYIKVFYN
ncbi:MAG: IS3 family transposase [Leptospirales bacterium]|nr:IS3 family transposase [Leptospirales bacterium]